MPIRCGVGSKQVAETVNRIVYYLSGVILLGVLAALLWAARTHQQTVQSLPDILAHDFRLLLEGESVTRLNLGEIERRAGKVKTEYPYIDEIIVCKMDRGENLVVVYPFFYLMDKKGTPPEEDPRFQSKVLLDDGGITLGTLFVKISAQRNRLFLAAIVGSILALCLLIAMGFYTIRSKDEEVRKTTSLLEEKQRELIHLERLALVGQVTANLIHDLKKPVLNIRAEADSISDEEIRHSIREETALFMGMLRDLQLEGFLKRGRERAEFVDIGDTLERSLRLVKYAQENVRVDTSIPDDLPFIFAQRHQLVQVFSNIMLNAFQALEGMGSIRISADSLEEDGERWLEIVMSDDGPGISYEVLTHIFEPFYSTQGDSESTGLGLYISKTIVESLGGSIEASSIPKHGANFTIRFPISQDEIST